MSEGDKVSKAGYGHLHGPLWMLPMVLHFIIGLFFVNMAMPGGDPVTFFAAMILPLALVQLQQETGWGVSLVVAVVVFVLYRLRHTSFLRNVGAFMAVILIVMAGAALDD